MKNALTRRLRLTERFFMIYGAAQLAGVSGFVWTPMLALWAALTLGLLIAALRDRRLLADASDFVIEAKAPREPRLGESAAFEATIEIVSARGMAQRQVRAFAPRTRLLEFESPALDFRPATDGARLSARFVAQVRELGYARLESWHLAVTSPNGLLRASFEAEIAPVEFRAAPERTKVSEQAFQQALRAQRLLLGARVRLDSRAAEQFKSMREYRYPDPLRHIDAKKSARYGKPMTRVFEAQHNAHLIIALDLGRSLRGQVRGSAKSDYYLSAALALAENAIRSRDRVSLLAFADRPLLEIRAARTLAPFHALFRGDGRLAPRDEESEYRLLPQSLSRLSGSRAIVVILADLAKPSVQDALLAFTPAICRKHLTVALSLSDRDQDLEARVLGFPAFGGSNRRDRFEEAYAGLLHSYWTNEKQGLFRDRFARLGGGSLAINDADWMTAAIRLYELLRSSQLA